MKRVLILATLLATVLAFAPAALAEEDARAKIGGGKTLLKLDRGTAEALGDAGVRVSAVGDATGPAGSPVFAFNVTGGKVDDDPAGGKIRHSGGLAFSGGGDRLVVKRFVINLDKGVLTARAGGDRVPLLALRGGKANLEGPVVRLSDVRAKLTPEAAAALNATFDTRLFKRGLPIGEASTTATLR
jgi:hypothetical protein